MSKKIANIFYVKQMFEIYFSKSIKTHLKIDFGIHSQQKHIKMQFSSIKFEFIHIYFPEI